MQNFTKLVTMAPTDPILGLTEEFNNNNNKNKVNLGVGIYYDEDGSVPLLKCVQKASKILQNEKNSKIYLPINGHEEYNILTQKLLLGGSSKLIKKNLVLTIQTIGGTGALYLAAKFLNKYLKSSEIYLPNPTWANHNGIFKEAGIKIKKYDYYDSVNKNVNFEYMLKDLTEAKEGSIILLHGCCHNPTGSDLTKAQWNELLALIKRKKLIPLIDLAYQGFNSNISSDAYAVRLFANSKITTFICNSYSKSFSLYGERIGALTVTCPSEIIKKKILSQLKIIIRTTYSNPPTFGASVVSTILKNPELKNQWIKELKEMKDRIKKTRRHFTNKIQEGLKNSNYNHILKQNGMFSYTGFNEKQIKYLKNDHSIFIVNSGRICVAAINNKNINYVTNSIVKVLKKY